MPTQLANRREPPDKHRVSFLKTFACRSEPDAPPYEVTIRQCRTLGAATPSLQKNNVDVIVCSLQQNFSLERQNLLLATSSKRGHDGLEKITAFVIVDELNKLDTGRAIGTEGDGRREGGAEHIMGQCCCSNPGSLARRKDGMEKKLQDKKVPHSAIRALLAQASDVLGEQLNLPVNVHVNWSRHS